MNEGETLKLVSHSMGGAFSTGIKEYLEEQGWNVEYSVFINTYQSDGIKISKDDPTFTIDYQYTNDPVLFWMDLNLGKGKIKNADIKIRVKSDKEKEYIHKGPISDGEKFWRELQEEFNKYYSWQNECYKIAIYFNFLIRLFGKNIYYNLLFNNISVPLKFENVFLYYYI